MSKRLSSGISVWLFEIDWERRVVDALAAATDQIGVFSLWCDREGGRTRRFVGCGAKWGLIGRLLVDNVAVLRRKSMSEQTAVSSGQGASGYNVVPDPAGDTSRQAGAVYY